MSQFFKLNAIASRVDYEFSVSKFLSSFLSESNQVRAVLASSSCLNLKSSTTTTVQTGFLHVKTIKKGGSSVNNVSANSKTIKDAKPIYRTRYFDPMLFRFCHRRLFSTLTLDPSSTTEKLASVKSGNRSSSTIIDAGHSRKKPINICPGMYNSNVTKPLWDAMTSIFERNTNTTADAPSHLQNELIISKTPSMSRTRIVYHFSTDYILREKYTNPWNELRMEILLEDLDLLAGTISYKHCCSNDHATRPLFLVTASVDKILLKKPIRIDTDMTIEGAVTWVGRSSVGIQLEVIQPDQDISNGLNSSALTANFTFVACDSKTGKSTPVNHLFPQTKRETLLWKEEEERNRMRKKKREEQKRDIDNEEANRINRLLLAEGQIFCDSLALAGRDSILMKDTCLQNYLICQPQQRNIHGRVFGGFLMRRALELAYTTAYSFAGAAPCFLRVDHVNFLKPVDVGNFLRFNSCVFYTELKDPTKPLIGVEVVAHVIQPKVRSSEVSNKFYFTFSVLPEDIASGLKIRNVVPSTEEEARCMIERIDAEKLS